MTLMLTKHQYDLVKRAARRAANRELFDAYLEDSVAGIRPTDAEVKHIVDEALAVARKAGELVR